MKVEDTDENRILLTKFCLQIASLDNIQVCLRLVYRYHSNTVGHCSDVHYGRVRIYPVGFPEKCFQTDARLDSLLANQIDAI